MSYVKGESDVNPTESETTSMVGNFPNGSREIPAVSNSSMELDRSGKARCHNPDMHASGKSDKCVVPEKSANLDGLPPSSESMEERHLTNEKAEQKSLDRAQNRNTDGKPSRPRSRGLLGIREAAKKDKDLKFHNLFSHLTLDLLTASFLELKKHSEKLRKRIHVDIVETGSWLASVYQGWCRYYAVPGNYKCLGRFQKAFQVMWLRTMQRRSQRGKRLTWKKFTKICIRQS